MAPDDEECWLVGPDDRELIFLRVPEPKTVKNRMHVCVRPTDRSREEEVERILGLGATHGRRPPDGARPRLGGARRPRGQRVLRADPLPEGRLMQTQKEVLLDYLQTIRESVLWKLEGASDYDVRRPLTPTGSNLLGIVKHLAYVDLGYFVSSFGRDLPVPTPFDDPDADPHDDLVAMADESRDDDRRPLPAGVAGVRPDLRRPRARRPRHGAVVAAGAQPGHARQGCWST